MARHLDRISQHSFINSVLSPGSIVFDFGVNQGEFALNLIEKYGCRVFAAEPVHELFDKIRRHDRLTLHRVAIGENQKSVKLLVNDDDVLSSTVLEHGTAASVLGSKDSLRTVSETCLDLEAFCKLNDVDRVDLVKVDIEGAELDLFETTSDEALRSCDQVTVEFHDYWYPDLAERTSRAKERLCDLGFHMIRFTPNNKDVLFVNRQEVKISDSEWLFLKNVTRNVNFGGRALRAAARRILRLDKAA
jgi:FkbM family methyltransferase